MGETTILQSKNLDLFYGDHQALKGISMDIPEKGRDLEEVIKEMCGDIMPYGNHSSHPRFFGFVPGRPP